MIYDIVSDRGHLSGSQQHNDDDDNNDDGNVMREIESEPSLIDYMCPSQNKHQLPHRLANSQCFRMG